MPEITSLLPAPGASSSTLICPERLQPVPGTLPTGCFPKQAHPSVPNANLPSSYLLHYTSLSTFPSVMLLFLLSCMFQSPFFLPKLSFLHFIKEASFCFICQLLQTFVIFLLVQPVHVLQGCASLLPCRVMGFFFSLPHAVL